MRLLRIDDQHHVDGRALELDVDLAAFGERGWIGPRPRLRHTADPVAMVRTWAGGTCAKAGEKRVAGSLCVRIRNELLGASASWARLAPRPGCRGKANGPAQQDEAPLPHACPSSPSRPSQRAGGAAPCPGATLAPLFRYRFEHRGEPTCRFRI
jgi:hypothetical protein